MNQNEYKTILKIIAESKGISPKEVEREMQRAIDIGFDSTDESVRAAWENIPRKGERPTVKEVIEALKDTL